MASKRGLSDGQNEPDAKRAKVDERLAKYRRRLTELQQQMKRNLEQAKSNIVSGRAYKLTGGLVKGIAAFVPFGGLVGAVADVAEGAGVVGGAAELLTNVISAAGEISDSIGDHVENIRSVAGDVQQHRALSSGLDEILKALITCEDGRKAVKNCLEIAHVKGRIAELEGRVQDGLIGGDRPVARWSLNWQKCASKIIREVFSLFDLKDGSLTRAQFILLSKWLEFDSFDEIKNDMDIKNEENAINMIDRDSNGLISVDEMEDYIIGWLKCAGISEQTEDADKAVKAGLESWKQQVKQSPRPKSGDSDYKKWISTLGMPSGGA